MCVPSTLGSIFGGTIYAGRILSLIILRSKQLLIGLFNKGISCICFGKFYISLEPSVAATLMFLLKGGKKRCICSTQAKMAFFSLIFFSHLLQYKFSNAQPVIHSQNRCLPTSGLSYQNASYCCKNNP